MQGSEVYVEYKKPTQRAGFCLVKDFDEIGIDFSLIHIVEA